ncbi:4548_t:CDS:2, partial [Gigaspora margarita]
MLFGEIGVGKSTFINALMNYFTYNSLDDAKYKEKVLIPSKFTIIDDNSDEKTIKIGENDPNEQLEDKGISTTKGCKSYVFHAFNKVIRFIDTPGLDMNKSAKTFKNILTHISHFQYLHGICILLKSNNAQLTLALNNVFSILSHFSRNANDNIVFCFTNSRETSYHPGNTRKHAIGWKNSMYELIRLVRFLTNRPPHKVKETLLFNKTKELIKFFLECLKDIQLQINETQLKINSSIIVVEYLKIESNIIKINKDGEMMWDTKGNITIKKDEKEYVIKMLKKTLKGKKVAEKVLVKIIKKLGCSEESSSDINELEETLYKNFACLEELSSYINEIDKTLHKNFAYLELSSYINEFDKTLHKKLTDLEEFSSCINELDKTLRNQPSDRAIVAIYKKEDKQENEFIYVENHYDLPEDNIALKSSLLN